MCFFEGTGKFQWPSDCMVSEYIDNILMSIEYNMKCYMYMYICKYIYIYVYITWYVYDIPLYIYIDNILMSIEYNMKCYMYMYMYVYIYIIWYVYDIHIYIYILWYIIEIYGIYNGCRYIVFVMNHEYDMFGIVWSIRHDSGLSSIDIPVSNHLGVILRSATSGYTQTNPIWLVVWNIFYFPIYWE